MSDPSSRERPVATSVLPAITVAVFLAAVDQTIVATALPRITRELGDAWLYPWVLSAYMVATTIFAPIAGAYGDIHGRRSVLLFGVVAFAAGSIAAGLAPSMQALVAARALLGVGAGVLTSNAFAVLVDLYPPDELARGTGLLSAVYGLAGAIGPPLGGLITDTIGWRWVFFVNVPFCVVVFAAFVRRLPTSERTVDVPLDVAGALLFSATLVPALFALSFAGEGESLASPRILGALGLSAACAAAFLAVERRAERPILALELFRIPTFSLSMAAMFGVALAMQAALSYAPMFFQQHLGMTPSRSGLVTAPLVLALAVTAGVAGRMLVKGVAHRTICAIGVAMATAALVFIGLLEPRSGALVAAAAMTVLGAGLGFTMPTLTLAAQGAVPTGHIGVTAALAKFFRALGGLVGVASAGAIVRSLEASLGDRGAAIGRMTLVAAGAMFLTLVVTSLLPRRAASDDASSALGDPRDARDG